MNPENIIEIVQSVMPAVVSCMGVVVSCVGVIKQFKQFKSGIKNSYRRQNRK